MRQYASIALAAALAGAATSMTLENEDKTNSNTGPDYKLDFEERGYIS